MILLVPALALTAGAVGAQVRSETPACGHCRIEVSRALVFGDTAGAGEMPAEIRSVKADGRGRFLVNGYRQEPPLLYDSFGRFRTRIGSRGRGPGELQASVLVSFARDTAWVLDGVNARVTGFPVDAKTQVAASWRTVGMSGALAAIRTTDGHVVANVLGSARRDFAIPMLRLGPEGERTPIGEVREPITRNQVRRLMRALAPAAGGGFWAAHYDRYRIERYDSTGLLLQVFERSPEWFPDGDGTVPLVDQQVPPKPTIFAVMEDLDGRLWVFTTVADRQFRRGVRGREGNVSPGQVQWEVSDYDLYLDTIVDVVDPARGQLVATVRVDQAILFGLSAGRGAVVAAGLRQLDSGHQQVTVYKIALQQPR